MNVSNRWRDFGIVALIAVALGAVDAWSDRTPGTCPACEFEALRATTDKTETPASRPKTLPNDRSNQADMRN